MLKKVGESESESEGLFLSLYLFFYFISFYYNFVEIFGFHGGKNTDDILGARDVIHSRNAVAVYGRLRIGVYPSPSRLFSFSSSLLF